MRVDLVTVPYRYDERGEGLGAGPDALLAAGLPNQLRDAGVILAGPHEAYLDPALQEEGRTALNIGRLGADTARLVAEARRNGDGALVLVGDDTAAIGVVSGLEQAAGADAPIGVVWVDAHGDFNTPETSFSGILAGMPVAILAGLAGPLWRNEAGLATPVATENIILAGVRELDEKEEELIRSTDVQVVPATELCDGDDFAQAVDRFGSTLCAALSPRRSRRSRPSVRAERVDPVGKRAEHRGAGRGNGDSAAVRKGGRGDDQQSQSWGWRSR